jgi:hypothetical protein
MLGLPLVVYIQGQKASTTNSNLRQPRHQEPSVKPYQTNLAQSFSHFESNSKLKHCGIFSCLITSHWLRISDGLICILCIARDDTLHKAIDYINTSGYDGYLWRDNAIRQRTRVARQATVTIYSLIPTASTCWRCAFFNRDIYSVIVRQYKYACPTVLLQQFHVSDRWLYNMIILNNSSSWWAFHKFSVDHADGDI